MSLAAEIRELRAQVAALRAEVAALQRARGPRDDHERAVLEALASIVGALEFSAADLVRRGALDETFGELLARADVADAREAGYLLRGAHRHEFAGGRLERGSGRGSWRFVRDASSIDPAW